MLNILKKSLNRNSKLLLDIPLLPLFNFGGKAKPPTDTKPQTRPVTLNPRVNP